MQPPAPPPLPRVPASATDVGRRADKKKEGTVINDAVDRESIIAQWLAQPKLFASSASIGQTAPEFQEPSTQSVERRRTVLLFSPQS